MSDGIKMIAGRSSEQILHDLLFETEAKLAAQIQLNAELSTKYNLLLEKMPKTMRQASMWAWLKKSKII
ncbi:MAG: hypothetical protein ACREQ5_08940 [Candidatus Dormibacteria bacterium]